MKTNADAKVLLVLPNERWGGKRPWMATPQTALILTALLGDGFDFAVLDANGQNLDEAACQAAIAARRPDVVLISGISSEYSRQYHRAVALARAACPGATVAFGGVYPTVMPEAVLADPGVDYVFLGHAEERVVPFLQALIGGDRARLTDMAGIGWREPDGRACINPVTSYIGDVARLARPDYSRVDLEPYIVTASLNYQTNSDRRSVQIVTSYGCPYNCVFCATRTISGRKVIYRPIEDVTAEIDFLVGRYGIEHLVFMDDNFVGDRQRVEAIVTWMIEHHPRLRWKIATVAAWHLDEPLLRRMYRAGLRQLTVSVESGSARVLHRIIRKPLKLAIVKPLVEICRRIGIDIGANFVIGFPGETWDEIRETFRFAEACDFDVVHFHIATPLPGTDLYRLARDQGCLPEDFDFCDPRFFGFARAFITTDAFTPQELMILRAYEWDRINFATPQKTATVARLYNTTLNDLDRHRRETRRNAGIHF